MSASRVKISPTILCLLISTLIALCYAANNNSSGETSANQGTWQFPPYGPCGYGACICAPGIPGMPGSPGPAGPAGIAGSPGPQRSAGPRGDRGEAGKPGSEGLQGPKGPPGTVGPKGTTGPAGPRGAKGDVGDKGNQGPPGLKGAPGTLGSNWKQCVWKNINDGKDSGLIKVSDILLSGVQWVYDYTKPCCNFSTPSPKQENSYSTCEIIHTCLNCGCGSK